MNKEKCQCHKQPCICINGTCNKTRSTDETSVENTNENELPAESIFEKIPLKHFDNMEACCRSKDPAEEVQPVIVEPNVPSIIQEEVKEKSIDCLECCDHMYTTVLHEGKHDCKDHCNITAELYCKLKKKNAEPGETLSECSTSSSSSSDSSNVGDYIDDQSTEYVSAQGKTEDTEDNSDIFFGMDDDSFNPTLHSTLIEDNRIPCQKEDCCIMDPVHICKNKTDLSQHTIGDSKKQIILKKLQKPNENENIFNDTSEEGKWTTIQPSSPRARQQNENQPNEYERTNKFYSTSQFDEQTTPEEIKWKTIEPEIEKNKVNAADSLWKSLLPENKDKFSGQSWKRQKLQIMGQPDTDDQSMDDRSKSQKHVLINSKEKQPNNNLEIQCIVKNRKRKFGSEETIFPDEPQPFERNPEFDLGSDLLVNSKKEDRKSLSGRRKRITIFNFVPENKLKTSTSDLDVTDGATHLDIPHPALDRTDSYLLLENKIDDTKRPWDTIVPRDRSDFQIIPKDSFIKKHEKKGKKKLKTENKPDEMHIRRKDPRVSFIRQKVTHYKPSKFLCFKYIPKVQPQGSSTSLLGENLLNQICIDPPDFAKPTTDISRLKYQGSRIPVSQFKSKTEQKLESELELITKISSEDLIDPNDPHPRRRRRTTLGVDEIRNVIERKSNVVRRTLIPPELRKTLLKRGTIKKSVFQANLDENASTSVQPQTKQRVTIFGKHKGSDFSLINKLAQQDQTSESKPTERQLSIKKIQENLLLFPEKTSYKSLNESNLLQKTCCSQTRIHVCIKESGEKIRESENILQTVKIDVTPKHSKIVKISVMPTVPEINKDGIITIPVQIQLSTSAAKLEPKEKLLYQENPESNWYEHYMEELFKDDFSSQNIPGDSYANLLWNKLKIAISESDREKSKTSESDNIEIQTDLTLGPKLLSKSLSSITSNDSSSTTQNKSEPVKKTGIDWDNILLPAPGSVAIKKVPIKKSKQRFTGDYSKQISIPSTSEGLPPTEEKRVKNVQSATTYLKTKLKGCCCPLRESKDEPYRPASEAVTREEIPTENTRSKIISLVFSESHYQNENYMNPLHKTQFEDGVGPCTSKPELPWTNILLPYKPQIRKMEKVSKTSTSITDQLETSTDDYNSSPSPKTTDTCPNLPEDSTHNCNCKMFNDKGTNTSSAEDQACTRTTCPSNNDNIYSSLHILKTFKEDPVLSAFKAFEEELKPVRKALAEVQSKLRALNIPELEYIFRKDPISEFVDMSRSNSQIGGDYRQPGTPYACEWSSDTRPSSCGRPSSYNRNAAEFFNHPRRHPCDYRVYRFATPPISVRSRTLSNDIWRAFGSCERNSVRGPHEKFWVPPNLIKMQTADSYNCLPCQSRPTEYVTFDSSGVNRYCPDTGPYFPNIFDRRVEMLNEDENLDYPSSYGNIPTSPNNYFQPQPECYCDESEPTSLAERLNSSHQVPTSDNYNKYIPVKVRPVTHYYIPATEGPTLHNPNPKKGIVYARTKIELPKRSNIQKSVRKIYPQPERHYCSKSEYFGFNKSRQTNDCAYEYPLDDYNLANFPSCYKEYSRNERYT